MVCFFIPKIKEVVAKIKAEMEALKAEFITSG